MTAPNEQPGRFSSYLAKDYASFRTLMLDHLAQELPELANLEVASLEMTLIEALAYVGDYLSQYQDAVASEAYIHTARLWSSLDRHARLLGLRISEGCSARTLVRFEVAGDDVQVARGTASLVQQPGLDVVHVPDATPFGGVIGFETLHPVTLYQAHNLIHLHPGSLPRPGATGLHLAGHLPNLTHGDFLVLRHDQTGWSIPLRLIRVTHEAGRDRLQTGITWHPADRLPPDTPLAGSWSVFGNLALADHGLTRRDPLPIEHPAKNARPQLTCPDLTFAAPFDQSDHTGASQLLSPDVTLAQPAIWLDEQLAPLTAVTRPWLEERWQARRDLLMAQANDRVFVPERQAADRFRLRFGDGLQGHRPQSDYEFHSSWRQGCGTVGNIGIDALGHVVAADQRVRSVGNPLPGQGGLDRPTLGAARQTLIADVARGDQARCVTSDDYLERVRRLPGVGTATCQVHHDGSGRRVLIQMQHEDGQASDPAIGAMVEAALEPYRLIGDRLSVDVVPAVHQQ